MMRSLLRDAALTVSLILSSPTLPVYNHTHHQFFRTSRTISDSFVLHQRWTHPCATPNREPSQSLRLSSHIPTPSAQNFLHTKHSLPHHSARALCTHNQHFALPQSMQDHFIPTVLLTSPTQYSWQSSLTDIYYDCSHHRLINDHSAANRHPPTYIPHLLSLVSFTSDHGHHPKSFPPSFQYSFIHSLNLPQLSTRKEPHLLYRFCNFCQSSQCNVIDLTQSELFSSQFSLINLPSQLLLKSSSYHIHVLKPFHYLFSVLLFIPYQCLTHCASETTLLRLHLSNIGEQHQQSSCSWSYRVNPSLCI